MLSRNATAGYNSVSEAYLSVLQHVWTKPDYYSCPRGWRHCREKLDYKIVIANPSDGPIVTNDKERNVVLADYLEKEKTLYASCSNDVNDFSKASKFWSRLSNPDGTINSAYGRLIWHEKSCGNREFNGEDPVTPWDWALSSLINDCDTRQAVLKFHRRSDLWRGNKDQVCTMHGNFLIRDEKLNFTVVMRSQDLVKGFVFDVPWFCSIMMKMHDHLLPSCPNLKLGSYTHFVHNLHVYEQDAETVKKMLGDYGHVACAADSAS